MDLRQRLAAHWLSLLLVFPAAACLSSCAAFPWLQKEQAPEQVMAPPTEEPKAVPEETAPVEDAEEPPAVLGPQASMTPPPPVKPRPRPSKPPAPPKPMVPALAPSELIGFEFAGVLKVLREPDAMQESAPSIVWLYSDTECSLELFFYPDIQTTKFHLLKYDLKDRAGQKLIDTSECMQQFMAMRNDGARTQ